MRRDGFGVLYRKGWLEVPDRPRRRAGFWQEEVSWAKRDLVGRSWCLLAVAYWILGSPSAISGARI